MIISNDLMTITEQVENTLPIVASTGEQAGQWGVLQIQIQIQIQSQRQENNARKQIQLLNGLVIILIYKRIDSYTSVRGAKMNVPMPDPQMARPEKV